MQTILIVEDDWELNHGIAHKLQKEGYAASGVHSLAEAKARLSERAPSLLLLDVNLPDGEGFTLMEWMRNPGKVQ